MRGHQGHAQRPAERRRLGSHDHGHFGNAASILQELRVTRIRIACGRDGGLGDRRRDQPVDFSCHRERDTTLDGEARNRARLALVASGMPLADRFQGDGSLGKSDSRNARRANEDVIGQATEPKDRSGHRI